jgi:integrase
MRGDGNVYRRGQIYWIVYHRGGQQYRESSRSTDEQGAKNLLKRRRDELGAARLGLRPFTGPAQERMMFEDLATDYLRDYDVRGLRSRETAAARVKHLRAFFGLDKALGITTERIRAYQAFRLGEKADPGTVNRETASLRTMFGLAVKAGRLSVLPVFPARLEENPPRQGFFEHVEYLAVREHLPPEYQDVLDFAYHSGWRRREITGLTWAEVDLAGGVIRLSPERSKTKTGRVLPLSPPLREVLGRRLRARRLNTALVFHYNGGSPVRDWRKSWAAACKKAGLWQKWTDEAGREHGEPTKRLHDCRRTAVRNLLRSGVRETVAMRLIGHKTRAMLDRYNIVSERDLQEAMARVAEYVAAQPVERTVVPLPMAGERSAR